MCSQLPSHVSVSAGQSCQTATHLQHTPLATHTPHSAHTAHQRWPLTPTVELNVLAMKLGERAEYHVIEPPRPAHQQPVQPFHFGTISTSMSSMSSTYDFRGMHYQRYHMPRGPYCATLNVGSRQFVGKGRTAQAARHAAAEEALKVLRQQIASNVVSGGNGSGNTTTNTNTNANSNVNSNCSDDYNKSPISLVHEMALKRNLSVKFEVIGESGPSHMPKFVTQCTVGDIVTKGEGNGKKISKKNAAISMLEELKKLEPLHTTITNREDINNDVNNQNNGTNSIIANQKLRLIRRKHFTKKKKVNITNIISNTSSEQIGEQSENKEVTNSREVNGSNVDSSQITNSNSNCNTIQTLQTIHPINRLIQLQQARKEKEPQFRVVSERCPDRRRREFTIECTISLVKGPNAPNIVSALGIGPNKKMAKKNAAESMLQQLGYSSKPQPQSILKQDSANSDSSHTAHQSQQQHMQRKIRQVKFVEDKRIQSMGTHLLDAISNVVHSQPTKLGRQLVPGLILMPSDVNLNVNVKTNANNNHLQDSNHI